MPRKIRPVVTTTTTPPTSSGTPTVFDNWDSRTTGAALTLGDAFYSTQTVSTDQAYSGTKSVKLAFTSGGYDNAGITCYTGESFRYDEIWLRVRMFFPTGFDFKVPTASGNGDSLKFLRMRVWNSAGTVSQGYNDLYFYQTEANAGPSRMAHIFEGEAVWTDFASGASRNAWQTWEAYYKLDSTPASSGGQARIRVWRDGTLISDISNRKTLTSATDKVSTVSGANANFLLFTYWNGGCPANQNAYTDDWTIYQSNINGVPGNFDASGNRFIGTT